MNNSIHFQGLYLSPLGFERLDFYFYHHFLVFHPNATVDLYWYTFAGGKEVVYQELMHKGTLQGSGQYKIAKGLVLFEINGVTFEGKVLADGIDFRLHPDDDFFLEGGIFSLLNAMELK